MDGSIYQVGIDELTDWHAAGREQLGGWAVGSETVQ